MTGGNESKIQGFDSKRHISSHRLSERSECLKWEMGNGRSSIKKTSIVILRNTRLSGL